MSDINLNFQDVINDLGEQVKRLTVDNAVLRAALQASQNASTPTETVTPEVVNAGDGDTPS